MRQPNIDNSFMGQVFGDYEEDCYQGPMRDHTPNPRYYSHSSSSNGHRSSGLFHHCHGRSSSTSLHHRGNAPCGAMQLALPLEIVSDKPVEQTLTKLLMAHYASPAMQQGTSQSWLEMQTTLHTRLVEVATAAAGQFCQIKFDTKQLKNTFLNAIYNSSNIKGDIDNQMKERWQQALAQGYDLMRQVMLMWVGVLTPGGCRDFLVAQTLIDHPGDLFRLKNMCQLTSDELMSRRCTTLIKDALRPHRLTVEQLYRPLKMRQMEAKEMHSNNLRSSQLAQGRQQGHLPPFNRRGPYSGPPDYYSGPPQWDGCGTYSRRPDYLSGVRSVAAGPPRRF